MKKNTKKKFRDIRNAIVMMCVMAAMLSTASYAWFTLTDSPTVTGMNMTAASTGGLKVSWDATEANFKNAIAFSDAENKNNASDPQVLVPVHPTATGSFAEGRYEGNKVKELKPALTSLKNKVAVYEFYIKSEETNPVNVGIICGNIAQQENMGITNEMPNLGGSLVRNNKNKTDKASMEAPNAVRVGLVVEGSQEMIIWEPNNDQHNTGGNAAVDETNLKGDSKFPVKVSSESTGNITTGGSANTSEKLFEVGPKATKVTMYVWLEGTDEDCVDEIKTDNLEAQIQFTVVDEPTTNVSP